MARLKISGLEEYSQKLQALKNTDAIIKPALYDGAGILYDAVKSEIETLPTDEIWRYPSGSYPAPKGIKEKQKEGLREGLGISRMENKGGTVNTRIGFSGYNNLQTKRFPGGEPNALVARELVLGTSRIPRNDFVKRAIRKAKPAAKAAMVKKAEEQIEKLMKG